MHGALFFFFLFKNICIEREGRKEETEVVKNDVKKCNDSVSSGKNDNFVYRQGKSYFINKECIDNEY